MALIQLVWLGILKQWERPVEGLPGDEGVIMHKYSCVDNANGQIICSSTTPESEPEYPWEWGISRPGRATDHNDGDYFPDDPKKSAKACKLVNDDDNRCYENCMLEKYTQPRPSFLGLDQEVQIVRNGLKMRILRAPLNADLAKKRECHEDLSHENIRTPIERINGKDIL